MAKIDQEPHEAYETRFRYEVVDFISQADGGPLRAQELTDEGGEDLTTPPAGAAIWHEWHDETDPERLRLLAEIERSTLRPLAKSAFRLVTSEEAAQN
jgi:hypothetical protein